jgi:glycosyltransferase involved in cell wall biosynthesis
MQAFSQSEYERLDYELGRFMLSNKGYLLFVGAIEPKKNVRTLIEAYLGIDTEIPLVLVGKKAWDWAEQLEPLGRLEGTDAAKRVQLLDFVGQDDLRSLYAGALGFIFPSLYEGFGLPPLEAMALGTPVVTSRVASLPEVCGDAALYVDPYSCAELRGAIESLIGDEALRDQLVAAGHAQASRFGIEQYAARLEEAYAKLL